MFRIIYYIILFVSLFVVLTSCQRTGNEMSVFGYAEENEKACRTLVFADSIMEDNPDSAYIVLRRDSAMINSAGKEERMMFAMLKTQAEDKLYMPHQSDSMMQEVVSYYEKHGSTRQLAQAYYILGRIRYDMHLRSSAVSTFKKVLDLYSSDAPVIYRYKSGAASWISSEYNELELGSTAMHYAKQAYIFACKSDVPKLKVYTLLDIARSYNRQGDYKKTESFYIKAVDEAERLQNPYMLDMALGELAYFYLENDKTDEAHKVLISLSGYTLNEDIASYWACWGMYYEKIGVYDSAIFYYTKAIPYAIPDVKAEISLHLARINVLKGQFKVAGKHYEKLLAYKDTVSDEIDSEQKDLLMSVEKILEIEKQNLRLVKEKDRNTIFGLTVLVVMTFIVPFLLYIYKRRGQQIKMQLERIQVYKRKQEEKEGMIQANKGIISQLEKELELSIGENTDLKNKLSIVEKEIILNKNRQLQLKESQFKLLVRQFEDSVVYKNFHNPFFKPSDEDYELLSSTLNNVYDGFTYRLKELCPSLNRDDLRLCCLVKACLLPKEISNIMLWKSNGVAMKRARLYKKIFKEKGSPADFDNFIYKF